MPEGLFVAQTNDEGVVTYVEISEVEDFSLSDELIEDSAKFKSMNDLRLKTVQESKKYKKRAQTAEAALSVSDEDDSDDNGDDATPPPDSQKPLDMDAMYTTFRNRFREEDAQARAEATELDTKLQSLLDKHKLGKETLPLLRDSSDPEVLATYLGANQYSFGDGAGGETPATTIDDNSFDGVYRNLGLGKK